MSTADDDQPNTNGQSDADLAANMARKKIEALYHSEPKASLELNEVRDEPKADLSKHQRYMQELAQSGKSMAEIQTAWHHYYVNLPDDEKHKVWQEFYKAQGQATKQPAEAEAAPSRARPSTKTVNELKKQIVRRNTGRSPLGVKHHLQSLAFGFGMGSLALLILLFGFFNERFIAPFISPSRNVSNAPIIVDPNSPVAGSASEIVIPKINVEIPVVYDQTSVDEKAIQQSLEGGVVHYATTPSPGEKGNGVIVGHSSNNILNHGKYKFAFVLLSRLDTGDTFYLTKGGKRYVYRVYKKSIVKPTDVSVLGAADKTATFSLITCDPPGTSINRLVVVGEQISPDPNSNTTSTALKDESQPKVLGGNAPSLWSRFVDWLTS